MSLSQVTDTTAEIAQLSVNIVVYFTDNSDPKLGTGVLIDGQTVVTAAHVVDSYVYPLSGPAVLKTIDRIEVVPALDGTTEPYGDYLANLSSITLYPDYTPGATPRDLNDDLAMFKLSGSGVSTSDIPADHYIGLSAFYDRSAADGWNVTAMGYPFHPSTVYDGYDLYQTSSATEIDGFTGFRIELPSSTAYGGQSGAGMVANVHNQSTLQTGENLGNSFLMGVVQSVATLGGSARGIYYSRDHLDWIMGIQASTADADDLPFVYHIGGSGADDIAATDRRDYMRGGAGIDTLNGGAGNDALFGQGDGDELNGGDGNDLLDGGVGENVLNGGDGMDVVSFQALTSGVTVSWTSGVLSQSSADNTLSSIEGIIGTNQIDTFSIDAGVGIWAGMGGNDVFNATWTGEDSENWALLLSLGEGDDDVIAPGGSVWGPMIILMDSEAGDDLFIGSFNIADMQSIGTYWFSDEGHVAFESWYITTEDESPYKGLNITYVDDSPFLYVEYYEHSPTTHDLVQTASFYLAGFESGDFGITSTFSPDSVDPQQEMVDLLGEWLLPDHASALSSNPLWDSIFPGG